MKSIKYILVAALSLGLFSCSDDWMTTAPEGDTKTADQKADAGQKNPESAAADINAMYAQMITLYAGLGDLGYSRHNDFGYASICILTEACGQDFTGFNIGYNWFSNVQYPNNRDNTLTTTDGLTAHLVWNTYYKIIKAANDVIALIDENDPGQQEAALCQALCVRAFCYTQLAQLYQETYVDAKDKPCVPIVKDNMPAEQQLKNPRATVKEVYDLIEHDLNYACNSVAFKDFVRNDKGFCDQAVAFGLRARVNLIKQNYAEAASDARQCLALSGATPLSIAECGIPGFANANAHNVIWANIVTENNDITQTGICNWASHMSSFYQDGYVGVGSYHGLSSAVYDQIPETDVRKGWWLNQDLESPLLHVGGYAAAKDALQSDPSFAYIVTKFGTKDGTIGGTGAAACDWMLMRAEEMYLIIAEADNSSAELEAFVREFRDPAYTCSGNVIDAVWFQRRIELWGEGFAFNDLLRLKKSLIRTTSSNWPDAWSQDIEVGTPQWKALLWRIPQAEIEANQGISEADNNPYVTL